MSEFTVTGRYQARDGWQEFTTNIDAPNEDVAREWVLSRFGSQHGLRRTQVDVSEVTAT
jgi:large subunit ribosomal protein LX